MGHYCFFAREKRILFLSDIDFTVLGPCYGNEESSIIDFEKSIKRIAHLLPSIIVSSHRSIIEENISDEFEKYLLKLGERENYTHPSRKRKNFGRSCRHDVYLWAACLGEIPLAYWEEKMIEKHLALLTEKGAVIKKKGKTYEKK